jgi:hypothetical protein
MKRIGTLSNKIRLTRKILAVSGGLPLAVLFCLFASGGAPAAQALTQPVSKQEKSETKPENKGKVFSGILLDIDLKDHPMTLTVENRGRVRRHFVFGGELLPRTLVWKNGKSDGVKALKKGDRVRLVYLRGERGPQVTHVRILP